MYKLKEMIRVTVGDKDGLKPCHIIIFVHKRVHDGGTGVDQIVPFFCFNQNALTVSAGQGDTVAGAEKLDLRMLHLN